MKQKFNVTGMTCSACSAHVEKAVSRLDGVQKAEVSLMTNSMTVQYDEDVLSPGGIIDAVVHAGYGASLPEAAAVKTAAARPEARMEEELSAMKHRLVWSFVFLIPLFYISMGHMMGAPLPEFLLGMENAVAFGLTQLLLTLPIMYLNDKYSTGRPTWTPSSLWAPPPPLYTACSPSIRWATGWGTEIWS